MASNARLLLLRLATACLAIGLLLQAVSTTVSSVLGERHTHRAPVSTALAQDSMAGWKDFRRAQYDHATSAAAHDHAHDIGARHHHEAGDASVLSLEAPGDADGVAAEMLQAVNLVLALAGGLAPMPPPTEASGDAWRASTALAFRSTDPRRLERPPQRA